MRMRITRVDKFFGMKTTMLTNKSQILTRKSKIVPRNGWTQKNPC